MSTLAFRDVSFTVPVSNDEAIEQLKGADKVRQAMGFGPIPPVDKLVLDNVSAFARPGEVLAIMGPSGAGKTSLLNILSGRFDKGQVSGEVRVDGHAVPIEEMRDVASYVKQTDALLGSQSVRETFEFNARLRLPPGMDEKQRKSRVQELLEVLGMEKVAESRVGDARTRGISGGEKRRVTIGSELISEPKLVFLDEPTSGLDSNIALSVMSTLSAIVRRGNTTAVCTIHQPRHSIFEQFDRLLLLHKGRQVYFGPAADALPIFTGAGFAIRRFVNPADHMLDVIKGGRVHEVEQAYQRSDTCAQADAELTSLLEQQPKGSIEDLKQDTEPAPYWVQYRALLWRFFTDNWRDPLNFQSAIGANVVLAVITGLCYWQLSLTTKSARDVTSSFFFIILNASFVPAFAAITVFPALRAVFIRERAAGAYTVGPFVSAMLTVQIPYNLLYATVYSIICYYMIGYKDDAYALVVFILAIWLTMEASAGVAIACAATVSSMEAANVVLTIFLTLLMQFNGYFLSLENTPVWFVWVYWSNYFKYAYESICLTQFVGRNIPCETNLDFPLSIINVPFAVNQTAIALPLSNLSPSIKQVLVSNDVNCFEAGEKVLNRIVDGIRTDLPTDFLILAANVLFFRFISYIMLRQIRVK